MKKQRLLFFALFIGCFFPVLAYAAPAIIVSASAVSILGTSQPISITVTLIDPNSTGMLRVSGTGIVPIMKASTVTPGATATVGPIYGNDVIIDGFGNLNGTYYKVQVFAVNNSIIASTPSLQNFYAFQGSGTIDLATATPLAPSFMTGTGGNVVMPGNLTVNGTATFASVNSINVTGALTAQKLNNIRFADQFAAGSQTGGIQEAINDFPAGNIGTVILPYGTITTTACITLKSNVHLIGHGYSGPDFFSTAGTVIQNTTTDVFCSPSAAILEGDTFENFVVVASGGHIFNLIDSQPVTLNEWRNLNLQQNNAAKSVLVATGVGGNAGFFGNHMHDFVFSYAPSSTTPAINIATPTVNENVIEVFRSTGSNTTAGTYAIWMEQTNAGGAGFDNIIRKATFEVPGGGAVKMLSMQHSGFKECGVFDLSVTPNNPLFVIAKGATGPVSKADYVQELHSTFGTAAKPDLQIDMSVSGQAAFEMEDTQVNWLDGVSAANGPGLYIRGSIINNQENVAYTNASASAANDLIFSTTDAGSKSYTIWNGYAGNNAGHLNIYQNGARLGSISPTGNLSWGGTSGSPNFAATTGGNIFNVGFLSTVEAAAPGGAASSDLIYADSTAHRWKMNNNNGGAVTVGTMPIYTSNGTELLGSPHVVEDTCTLGTNCGITFSGAAAFTNASSYSCSCHDQTTPLNACGVNQTGGAGITITGTGTDIIRYLCAGN